MTLHFLNDVANDQIYQIRLGKTYVESRCQQASILKALPGKLDIKRHSSSMLYVDLLEILLVNSVVYVNVKQICQVMPVITKKNDNLKNT